MFRLKAKDLTKAPMRDPPSLKASLLRIVIALGGYALVLLLLLLVTDRRTALILAVLLSPAVIPLLVPGVLGAIPAYVRWARDRPLERWQGQYYAFEERQIRIIEHRQAIYIVLADVSAACQLRVSDDELLVLPRGSVAELEEFGERALTDTAMLQILAKRSYRDANRFRLWLERDVLPPLYRRRTGQRVPYQFERREEEGGTAPERPTPPTLPTRSK